MFCARTKPSFVDKRLPLGFKVWIFFGNAYCVYIFPEFPWNHLHINSPPYFCAFVWRWYCLFDYIHTLLTAHTANAAAIFSVYVPRPTIPRWGPYNCQPATHMVDLENYCYQEKLSTCEVEVICGIASPGFGLCILSPWDTELFYPSIFICPL